MAFLHDYALVIAFYAAVILLIYLNRKKFAFQGKIIAMYRTKIGLKTMHKWGDKAGGFIRALAIIGVVIGFAGMITSVVMIIDGFYKLLFVPQAPPTFAPVIPGVKIPGLGIKVPLFIGLIALFVSVAVHEFSHGVVAAARKLRVKSSGFVMFGPLPGAFVEPDEKQLEKASTKTQLSVYAAGPFSNILLTIVLIILFGFLPLFVMAAGGTPSHGLETFTKYTSIVNTAKIKGEMYVPTGMTIMSVVPGSGAADAGLQNMTVISAIDGVDLRDNLSAFAEEIISFQNLTPGDEVNFSNDNQSWQITTKPRANNASRGQIGIVFDQNFVVEKNPVSLKKYGVVGFWGLEQLFTLVFWIILLSSGLGLANLLPLGPVDGGRMLLATLERFMKKEKAQLLWGKISTVVFIAVIILVIGPILLSLF